MHAASSPNENHLAKVQLTLAKVNYALSRRTSQTQSLTSTYNRGKAFVSAEMQYNARSVDRHLLNRDVEPKSGKPLVAKQRAGALTFRLLPLIGRINREKGMEI